MAATQISVITVCHNAADSIGATLESVLGQSHNDFESVVIDGASEDATPEIIARLADADARLRWRSEPDDGIYDAMNKGVRLARGQWVLFMNAGDRFHDDGVLARLAGFLPECDLVYGDTIIDYGYMRRRSPGQPIEDLWRGNVCAHQSLLSRRELHLLHPFLLEFPINADYEFMLWAVHGGARACRYEGVVSIMDAYGISRQSMLESALNQYRVSQRYHSGARFLAYESWKLARVASRSLVKRLLPERLFRYLNALLRSTD